MLTQQETTSSVWRPEGGESISTGCCAFGMAVVYLGGGQQGRLVAVQVIKAVSPAKRKRDELEDLGLRPVVTLPLPSDPSCMELQKTREGRAFSPDARMMQL